METKSNIKNIIVGIFTIITLALMAYTFSVGGAYNGGEHGKVIEDLSKIQAQKIQKVEEKDDRQKEMDKLNALREKAGNSAAFKVSREYKSKCSSCHGVDGMGEQNGKKLMGTKLFGQTSEKIYTSLVDFKTGKRENLIMKGLLIPMKDVDLKRLADEIGDFPKRAQESAK